ncbi:MAG: hypothetical protein LUD72_10050, partial [Bacteroidales bacterium]|nr:hypothetical protein [Bacteroidales bacterium]
MECILLPSVADRARNCEPAPIPAVGEIYNYYDDGKVRTTRQLKALVTKVVPFDEVDEGDKKKWEEDVKEDGWLYAEKT